MKPFKESKDSKNLKNLKNYEMKINIRELCVMSLLAALMFAGQVVFSFIPNVEIVSLLIIVCTLIYRYKALYIIYVFVFLELIMWGFGQWWIAYLYIWTILWLITMIFSKIRSVIFWTVVSGIYGLLFGLFTAFIQFFIGGIGMAVAYWVSGIPFDVTHCIGNIAVTLVLFKPVYMMLEKLNSKIR